MFIIHALKPPVNAYADIFSGARGLKFGLSLHLHPYFVYVSSKGSGGSSYLQGLAWPLLPQNEIRINFSCRLEECGGLVVECLTRD